MAVSDAAILHAIEAGMLMFPEIPGRCIRLRIPGVQGRISNIPFPLTNLVGEARLTEANADETIRTVCNAFHGAPLGWLVGPSTLPSNLPDRLTAAGFVPEGGDMAGMVLRDLTVALPPSPGVTVREGTAEDGPHFQRIATAGFGLPADVSSFFGELLQAPGALPNRSYLAFLDGVEDPVGFGTSVYLKEDPILMLGGAAVLPEYRGKGAYRALLARRLADSHAEGREAAVIQAVRTTSAPICAKAGMVEVCGLRIFIKVPSSPEKVHTSEKLE